MAHEDNVAHLIRWLSANPTIVPLSATIQPDRLILVLTEADFHPLAERASELQCTSTASGCRWRCALPNNVTLEMYS